MTSATPIFEQLCRDFHDAGKTQPVEAPQPPIVSRPPVMSRPQVVSRSKAPAHSLEDTGRGQVYQPDGRLPRALAEWACPTG
jgi:hypothetical protein